MPETLIPTPTPAADAIRTAVLERMRPNIRRLVPYASARSQFQGGEGDSTILLDANENPFAPVADPARPYNRYPEPQPAALVAQLAGLWQTTPEHLVLTRGGDDAIDLVIRCFCSEARGDAIVIHPPTFLMYQVWAEIQGAGVVSVPLGSDGQLDVAGLIAAGRDPATALVFLCTPNNPTGVQFPLADRMAVIEGLAGHAVVLVDEAYIEFTGEASAATLIARWPHVMVMRTASKGLGLAGLRLGGLIGDAQVMRPVKGAAAPYPLGRPVVESALRALSPLGRATARERIQTLVAERERLRQALLGHPDVAEIAPSAANFLFVTFHSAAAAAAAHRRLRDTGIIVRHFGGSLDRSWRLSIGAPAENDLVLATLGLGQVTAGPPPRRAEVMRQTSETSIRVVVDLDAEQPVAHATGIGFYDHMLDQLARHGGFSCRIQAEGDLHIDGHHTIEDVALALGQALRQALGDKAGIGRYGFAAAMDEARAEATLDLSGRPLFRFDGQFPSPAVGAFDAEMTPHVFRSLSDALGCALHLSVTGDNTHHMIEACFKAVGRALRPALARSGAGGQVPSTKGVL